MKKPTSPIPDLQTQLEELLHQVWRSEADWRLWDRIDAAEMLRSKKDGDAPRGRGQSAK